MLSRNEMMAMERFINFINEDEDYIKYHITPVVRGQRIWAVKVIVSSSACESVETTVRIEDMLARYDEVCDRIMSIAKKLERNIFILS